MKEGKQKLLRVTTVPMSLDLLLHNQLAFVNKYFNVVGVSSPGKEMKVVREREGIEVKEVPMEREIAPLKDLVSLVTLILLFIKEKPTIVHANTPKASLLSMVAGWISRVPVRIYTVTGLRFETVQGNGRKILIFIEKLTCRFASHVVAESKGVKELLHTYSITNKQIDTIGNGHLNGVDHEYWKQENVSSNQRQDLKIQYRLEDSNFVFLFVGRLVIDKGIRELVEAFDIIYQSFNHARLLLVGDMEKTNNQLPAETLRMIETHPGIITTGYQSDVRKYYAIADVLVLPSYREGFPNVILQAGAMSVPVISTNVNGAVEVIDGRNGKIVPKQDAAALKNAMLPFIKGEITIDRSYCRQVIVDAYAQQSLHPKIVAYYQATLANSTTYQKAYS